MAYFSQLVVFSSSLTFVMICASWVMPLDLILCWGLLIAIFFGLFLFPPPAVGVYAVME
jgi:hypothetical protein